MVPYGEFHAAAVVFLRDLVDDLSARCPELDRNPAIGGIRRRLQDA
ncbi:MULTISPECIES: hypothetical protein [unclassified Streptomyces]|nr:MULTISPECIES: hypothetical protein [unclassified Streptomyces]